MNAQQTVAVLFALFLGSSSFFIVRSNSRTASENSQILKEYLIKEEKLINLMAEGEAKKREVQSREQSLNKIKLEDRKLQNEILKLYEN